MITEDYLISQEKDKTWDFAGEGHISRGPVITLGDPFEATSRDAVCALFMRQGMGDGVWASQGHIS